MTELLRRREMSRWATSEQLCALERLRILRYLRHLSGTRLAIVVQAQATRRRLHKPCCGCE